MEANGSGLRAVATVFAKVLSPLLVPKRFFMKNTGLANILGVTGV